MDHHATLTFPEPLVRRAVFGYWRRTVGLGFAIALLILLLGLGRLVYSGDRSWLVGVLASAVMLGIGFPIALFVVHYRNSIQKFRAMGEPSALLVATESTLSITSGAGVASVPWSSVVEVWRFPDFWLLLFSRSQFVTLPLADVPPSVQTFILDRVREAGGKTA